MFPVTLVILHDAEEVDQIVRGTERFCDLDRILEYFRQCG